MTVSLSSAIKWKREVFGSRTLLLAVLTFSFVGKILLRLVVLHDDQYWQSGYSFYYQMADNFLRTGTVFLEVPGPETGRYYAFRPPLYPLFIAAVCQLTQHSAAAFVCCEALVSTFTVWLVYWITARLAGEIPALFSACLYAFYPYSFYHDTQLQESVLYNALVLASVAWLLVALDGARSRFSFLAGVASGAAALTRLSHMAPILFLLAVLLFTYRYQRQQGWPLALAFILGTLGMLGPWLVRNRLVVDRFALTSETGFALARAYNEYTFRYYPYRASIDVSWDEYQANLPPEKRRELARIEDDEFACGQWYRQQALDYIRSHPLETFLHGLYKAAVSYLGILSPLQGAFKNWIYFISYWSLTLLALLGLYRIRGTSFFKVVLALVLAQAATSFIFWAHTSHRSFLDPLFAIPAGIGVAAWVCPCSLRQAGSISSQVAP
jgi:4-amino-4-deoxy-L-arabinose transferase-like glycosyltransferase